MANTYDLVGKSAIVTGGAKGIGRAIVERLLASGARIWIWDACAVEVPGVKCSIVDVTDPDQISACLAQVTDDGRIDILVNDAGIWGGPGRSSATLPTIGVASSKSI